MGTHACNPSVPETAEFKEQKENRHITIWFTKYETAAFFPSKVMPGGGPKYQSPNHNLWLERTVRVLFTSVLKSILTLYTRNKTLMLTLT